jgi:hypothetical protein
MTYKDKASYGSLPPYSELTFENFDLLLLWLLDILRIMVLLLLLLLR